MTFKLIVAGGRDFKDYGLLEQAVIRYVISRDVPWSKITIISGGAIGADTLGEEFAEKFNLDLERFVPDWTVGKQGGAIRNAEMAKHADGLIAFYNGSNGTANMIQTARRKKLDVEVIRY